MTTTIPAEGGNEEPRGDKKGEVPPTNPRIAVWLAVIGLGGPLVTAIATVIVTIITTRANAVVTDKKIGEANAAITAACPIGSIVAYGGDAKNPRLPGEWKLCAGQEFSISEYEELSKVLGESWGRSTDPEKFKLPDLRGQFLRGLDGNAGIDPDGAARTVGSVQQDSIRQHNHIETFSDQEYMFNDRDLNRPGTAYGAPLVGNKGNKGPTYTGGVVTPGDHKDAGGLETRPKNCAVNWIIRVR